jgi:hypothetical protein
MAPAGANPRPATAPAPRHAPPPHPPATLRTSADTRANAGPGRRGRRRCLHQREPIQDRQRPRMARPPPYHARCACSDGNCGDAGRIRRSAPPMMTSLLHRHRQEGLPESGRCRPLQGNVVAGGLEWEAALKMCICFTYNVCILADSERIADPGAWDGLPELKFHFGHSCAVMLCKACSSKRFQNQIAGL